MYGTLESLLYNKLLSKVYILGMLRKRNTIQPIYNMKEPNINIMIIYCKTGWIYII